MTDSQRLCKLAIKQAKERAGQGWELLGKELQDALIAREVMGIISANESNPGWENAAALVAAVTATRNPVEAL